MDVVMEKMEKRGGTWRMTFTPRSQPAPASGPRTELHFLLMFFQFEEEKKNKTKRND